jgi:non-specific serine/threonine protein kinase
MLAEALRASRTVGHPFLLAQALRMMGMVALVQDDADQAQLCFAESLALCRVLGDRLFIGVNLRYLGEVARRQGDYLTARALFAESLVYCREDGSTRGIDDCIESLAMVMGAQGRLERAVRLLGAADALREAVGGSHPHQDSAGHDHNVAVLRAQLNESDFVTAWALGRAMTLEQAVAFALDEDG